MTRCVHLKSVPATIVPSFFVGVRLRTIKGASPDNIRGRLVGQLAICMKAESNAMQCVATSYQVIFVVLVAVLGQVFRLCRTATR